VPLGGGTTFPYAPKASPTPIPMPMRLTPRAVPAALVAVALLACRPAAAQDEAAPDTARPLVVRGEAAAPDSASGGITPRGAFLRSLVLPGWGQSELGAPVRGGVYFALEAGSLWMLYKSDRRLREALQAQRIARETGALAPTARLPLVRDRQNQREDWITLSLFWLFFAGADAFVAAHLQDFDVQVGGDPGPGGALQLRARVPFGP
jgi:hypothetical protein